ncbi:MAG TPA: tetraacyldisaccharide 4'-kinase, partial [Anseongella sp.]|nr:tetraacyldisaccharide 4'-kinase [Anseongella sp.]
MNILRILFLPVSMIYGLVVIVRNLLYDRGVLESRGFDLPVVVVGNLEVGGAGKTPVIEYLIRLLKGRYRIAVLSRGYGRETRGFIRLEAGSLASPGAVYAGPSPGNGTAAAPRTVASRPVSAARIGDEPFQYFLKFRDITVAVGEDRAAAIERLKDDHQIIL